MTAWQGSFVHTACSGCALNVAHCQGIVYPPWGTLRCYSARGLLQFPLTEFPLHCSFKGRLSSPFAHHTNKGSGRAQLLRPSQVVFTSKSLFAWGTVGKCWPCRQRLTTCFATAFGEETWHERALFRAEPFIGSRNPGIGTPLLFDPLPDLPCLWMKVKRTIWP